MMLKLQLALLLTVGLLAGCGQVAVFGHTIGEKHSPSEVKADSIPTPQAAVSPRIQMVKDVRLVLTPQAATKVANDAKFNADTLLEAIKGELRSRKLLDDTDSRANGTAEISIDDFAMRPTSNAVVFGYLLNAGTLNGEIRVRDTDGKDLQNFRVEAESQVSIAASGETKNPLEPLYRRFAVLAGDNLAGTPSKSDLARDQLHR
jgi:hypothetical protein